MALWHPPFSEGDFIQLGFQHTHEPVPSLREQLSALSPNVEAVVLRALAKNPKERFPSVQVFAEELERVSKKSTPPSNVGERPEIQLASTQEVENLRKPFVHIPDPKVAKGQKDRMLRNETLEEVGKKPSVGTRLYTYTGHTHSVNAVAWSPDGTRLASGSDDKTVQVWEASSGRVLSTYRGHSDWVTDVVWCKNTMHLASCSDDKTAQVWRAS